jgi:hypothetical protein
MKSLFKLSLVGIVLLATSLAHAEDSTQAGQCVPSDDINSDIINFYKKGVFPALHQTLDGDKDVVSMVGQIEDWFRYQYKIHHDKTNDKLYDKSLENTEEAKLLVRLVTNGKLNSQIKNDKELWASFEKEEVFSQDPEYRAMMAKGVDLQFLYKEPSGVSEGYSVGEHTSRVLYEFIQQKKFYSMDSMKRPADVRDLAAIMTFTLAFHDIGKSIAYRGGDKNNEIVFSAPLISHLMKDMSFTPGEAKLATALVKTHQLIGTLMKAEGGGDPQPDLVEDDRRQIKAAAQEANMKPGDFFNLMRLVFVSDASSYPTLMQNVFHKDEQGQLIPNTQQTYEELNPDIAWSASSNSR